MSSPHLIHRQAMNTPHPQGFARLAVAGLSVWFASAAAAEDPVQFNRDIRPILSEKCFHCHGPDQKTREAGLRLDTFEGATADGAIQPGKAALSEVIARIVSTDPDDLMPPPKSKVPGVTSAELALLKRWIDQGAAYEAHWSFVPLQKDRLTVSPGSGWLDAVVEKGLAARGLTLQARASADTLVRRLSFDLTGLPPEPGKATLHEASFETDLERLVDELLASPAFGERMAVDWLDVARYADSYGFQVDRPRDVWMWRDWVIQAFNQNLPFDQFVTWQLAGDLLPNPTEEQILATAFNRLHQQESEGGSVEEEYRVEYVADRVQTFATTFLGLTFECSRCHDHKYDPITQADYFGLFSLFQNIDEAGLYSFFTPSVPTPALMLTTAEEKHKLATAEAKVHTAEAALAEALRQARPQTSSALENLLAGEVARFDFETQQGDKVINAIDDKLSAVVKGENQRVPGRGGQVMQFTGDDAVDLPLGNFKRHDPFSIALWLKTPDVKERAVVLHRSRAWTDAASRGYELLIEDGRLKWSLIHFWPGNAISVRTTQPLPVEQWTHVVVTNDGSSRAAGLTLYVNGQKAELEVVKDALTKDIAGGGGDNISLGERFRDRGFKGGQMDDLRVFERELTALEVLACLDASAPAKADPTLIQAHAALVSPEVEEQRKALRQARAELTALLDGVKEIMVMKELPTPKPAYILYRGEYDQRREQVPPAVPSALPPLPPGAPLNRLGLAQWLTAPNHPLLARVTVNRIWQSLFGRGLVKTAEDLGSQGEKPLYPELLDGLALSFIESGWDLKKLLKTIVLSRVYQQRSLAAKEVMENDPENEWLARGPRFRLPAEMIRDNALAAAGLLKQTLGGPPVNPYELVEAFKPFKASEGDGLYRRSLYTTWQRTSPPPAMLTFDAPRRAVCSAKRERTDSPLQALILLNGTQYVEAAKMLGVKLLQESKGEVSAMIELGMQRCLSRQPDAQERAILTRLWQEQVALFTAQPEEAAKLLTAGTTTVPADLNPNHVAAATCLAQALLNHDECVVKR
jgi:hypothetical protein